MSVKMLVWAGSPRESCNIGSMVARYTYGGKESAVSVARDIDERGQAAIDERGMVSDYPLVACGETYTARAGHGVTVQHQSGKLRTVRA